MKTQLKDNIWIEGFNELASGYILQDKIIKMCDNIIYAGKTSEIPEELEELAENIDTSNYWNESRCNCGERDTCYYCQDFFDKNDLQKICDKEYCIIYKTK